MELNRHGLKRAVLRLIPTVSVAAAVTVAAQIIRYFAAIYLKPVSTAFTLDGFFRLHYITNTGASFGMFSGYTSALSVFTAVLLVFMLIIVGCGYFKSLHLRLIVGAVIGGGFSNLLERLIFGYVVDYFEVLFVDFAVFNFADCFVTVGAILLLICVIFFDRDIFTDKNKKED